MTAITRTSANFRPAAKACQPARAVAAKAAPAAAARAPAGARVAFVAARGGFRRQPFICRAEEGSTDAEASTDEASTDDGIHEKSEDEPEPEPEVDTGAELLAKLEGVDAAVVEEVAALVAAKSDAEAAAKKAEEDTAATKDALLRLTADFENFRKRTAKEKEQIVNTTKGNMLESLLPVVDNFELAKGSIKTETEGEEKIDASYQGLYKQMVEVFRGLGLESVPAEGQPFNPEVHDAIMREPSEEAEDGIILQEFRRGFTFNGVLLRPAMVKVCANETAAPAEASEDAVEEEA